ncbi:MAG: hypothetical protein ACO3SP_00765 [Ilumatobacteraceae bacterium]
MSINMGHLGGAEDPLQNGMSTGLPEQRVPERGVTPEDPPDPSGWQRRSFWVMALQSARQHPSWVRVHRLYTAKTASQIASDLRSAHRRQQNNVRVRGVLPGERWDARWGASPDGPPDQFCIWVRLIGNVDGEKPST